MAWNKVRSFCLNTNQDPTSISGRTDLHSENFHFLDFLGFQIPRFPDSQISRSKAVSQIAGASPAVTVQWLRGGSAALPDHKVQEIQRTRTIAWEPHQRKPRFGNFYLSDKDSKKSLHLSLPWLSFIVSLWYLVNLNIISLLFFLEWGSRSRPPNMIENYIPR